MVITEYFMTRGDGVILNRTYSNAGMLIHKVGTEEFYGEAIDIEGASFVYEETDISMEEDSEFTDAEFRNMIEEAVE
jgi:hypothetical protein